MGRIQAGRRGALVVACLAGLLPVLPAADPAAASEPSAGRIAFAMAPADLDGDARLDSKSYSVAVGGGLPVRLTASDDAVDEFSPAMSPDGSRVALALQTTVGQSSVAVFEVGASTPLWQLPFDGAIWVAWSPDGSTLAFTGQVPAHAMPDLWVTPADGSGSPRRVATTAQEEERPVFSPDGTRLAAASPNDSAVHVLDIATGSDLAIPVPGSGATGAVSDWTADGILATRGTDAYRLDPSGVGDPVALTFASIGVVASPDGESVAGSVTANSINVARLDGSAASTIDVGAPPMVTDWYLDSGSSAPVGALNPYPPMVDVTSSATVTVDGISDADGVAVTAEIDWGDGPPAVFGVGAGQTRMELEHQYAAPGQYTITATIIDDSGQRSVPSTLTAYISQIVTRVTPQTGSAPTQVTVDFLGSTFALPPTEFLVAGPESVATSPTPSVVVDVPTVSYCGFSVSVSALDPVYGYPTNIGYSQTPACLVVAGDQHGGIVGAYNTDVWLLSEGFDDTALTTGAADDRFPHWDETGRRVVFERDGDLWLVDGASRARRLTTTRALERWGDLHGDDLVFVRSASAADVRVMDIDSGAERILWDGATSASQPRWSPDGNSVVFVVGGSELWVAGADGSGARAVLTGHASVTAPSFSPDGLRIVFATAVTAGSASRLWTIDADGTDAQQVGVGDGLIAGFPAFSPDGTRLVFGVTNPLAPRDGSGLEIWTSAVDGSDAQFFETGATPDWIDPAIVPPDGGSDDVTIVVSTTSDDPVDDGCNPSPGDCTLHEAIDAGNDTDADEDVRIELPTGDIHLGRPLPELTRPVTLVGGGGLDDDVYAGDVDPVACDGFTFVYGANAGPGAVGLRVSTGTSVTRYTRVHGVGFTGFDDDGMRITGSNRVRVDCSNFSNNGGDGIDVRSSRDVAILGPNDIQRNGGDGISVSGASRRVRTWGGRIRDNGLTDGTAIDLGADGPTPNDPGDADIGPNGLVNAPVIIRRVPSSITTHPAFADVVVRVEHDVSTGPFRVDLYQDLTCGNGTYHWIGTMRVDLSSTTARRLRIRPFMPGPGGITATVTTGAGTSEVSACFETGSADLEPGGPGPGIDPTIIGPGGSGTGASDDGIINDGIDIDDDGHDEDSGIDNGGGDDGGDDEDEDDEDDEDDGDDGDDGGGPIDTTPTSPGYFVEGPAGEITVDAAPGALTDAAGDSPLHVERVEGGDMPWAAWTLAPDGTVTMDARSLSPGVYSGQFVVIDGDGDSSEVVSIVFLVTDDGELPYTPIEQTPIARPDTITIAPGTRVLFADAQNILANDTGPSGQPLRPQRVPGGTAPTALATVNADGTLLVDARNRGEGTFTLRYRDLLPDGSASNTTTITVIIDNGNTCATAVHDHYDVASGDQVRIPAAAGVLANDRDPEGAPLTASLIGTFTARDISMATDGSINFDARGDGPGSFRQFQYYAVDPSGERCAPATVRIDVAPNLVPTTLPNTYDVYPGMRLAVPALGVLGGDLDPDGPESGLRAAQGSTRLPGLTISGDGSLDYRVPTTARIGRTMVATYVAVDPLGGRSGQTEVRFVVRTRPEVPPPNRAPIAQDDLFYRVHADEVLVVTAFDGALANDSDPDGDDLYAEPVTPSDRTRIPILRSGGFIFTPTLADIGRTFTQSYYAVERTFEAARSPVRTVRIQVVPPITRCSYTEVEVTTSVVNDFSGTGLELADATSSFMWCWNQQRISDFGFTDDGDVVVARGAAPVGELDYDVHGALTATLGLLPGLNPDSTDRHGGATLARSADATRVLFRATPAYELCLSPIDLVLDLVGFTKAIKHLPVVGSKLAKYIQGVPDIIEAAWLLMDLVKGMVGITAELLERAVGHLPVLGDLLDAWLDGADEAPMTALGYLLELADSFPAEGLGPAGPAIFPLGAVYASLVDDDDGNDITLSDAVSCPPLGGFSEAFADAVGYVGAEVNQFGHLRPPDVGGSWGFLSWGGGFALAFDLSQVGSGTVEWDAVTGEVDVRERTCDYTRVRPNQQPQAPAPLPGEAAVIC